jgi:hypothetical protein
MRGINLISIRRSSYRSLDARKTLISSGEKKEYRNVMITGRTIRTAVIQRSSKTG